MQKTYVKNTANREVLFYMLHIAIPLLIGASVYIWASEDSYWGNWVSAILPITKIQVNSGVLTVLRNWGCDFLWAFSLFFAIALSIKNHPASTRKSGLLALTVATATELLQLVHVPGLKCGTFDFFDIIAQLCAVCFGGVILHLYRRNKGRENYERKQKW